MKKKLALIGAVIVLVCIGAVLYLKNWSQIYSTGEILQVFNIDDTTYYIQKITFKNINDDLSDHAVLYKEGEDKILITFPGEFSTWNSEQACFIFTNQKDVFKCDFS